MEILVGVSVEVAGNEGQLSQNRHYAQNPVKECRAARPPVIRVSPSALGVPVPTAGVQPCPTARRKRRSRPDQEQRFRRFAYRRADGCPIL